MIRNILLATDGSAPAERASTVAASLARRYGAHLTIIHAYIRVPSYQEDPRDDKVLYETYDEAKALLDNLAGRMRELGVQEVRIDMMPGPAADVILHLASLYKPDVLVIGARGLGAWIGAALGSVSLALTHRAACPVLVVK